MSSLNTYIGDLHKRAYVIDAHCDTMLKLYENHTTLRGTDNYQGHVTLPKMLKGGVHVQFFAIFIEPQYKPAGALKRALQLLDFSYQEIAKNSEAMVLATTSEEINSALKSGKIAALLTIEGGEALEGDLGVLRMLYRLGIRSLGLTWNQRNDLADGVGELRSNGGLTTFGAMVVAEMNRLGMLIDVAHLGTKGFWDVLDLSSAPVMVSHANCEALCKHRRNLSDAQIKALARQGGVVGMSFVPEFVSSQEPTLGCLLDHVDHVCRLVGPDFVGLGSDFDGTACTVRGLDDVSSLPALTRGLYMRGYGEQDIAKILGGNWLRIIQQVLK